MYNTNNSTIKGSEKILSKQVVVDTVGMVGLINVSASRTGLNEVLNEVLEDMSFQIQNMLILIDNMQIEIEELYDKNKKYEIKESFNSIRVLEGN